MGQRKLLFTELFGMNHGGIHLTFFFLQGNGERRSKGYRAGKEGVWWGTRCVVAAGKECARNEELDGGRERGRRGSLVEEGASWAARE